jgi:hypothetical protein
MAQNQMSTRATSPLAPCDFNTQRRVTFNYRNEGQARPATSKVFAISPPPQKLYTKVSDRTESTTLASSCIPN